MTAAAFASTPTPAPRAMRVVVLDDDPVFRLVISRMLTRIGLEVVSSVGTIEAAKRWLDSSSVDAVTVDVVLKNESGLDFLKWCRAAHPRVLPVLVTAGTEKSARTGVDAVFLGAAALLTKPEADGVTGFEGELRRVFLETKLDPHGRAVSGAVVKPGAPALKPELRRELVAVGSSTGGPPALLKFLKGLPGWMDAPIIITQHMPELHMGYLAELLAQQCGRPVEVPADNTRLMRGRAYLAGHGKHLIVERQLGRLFVRQFDGPEEHHCKPAVDPMFRSVAQHCPGTAIGVVLTGMGADGARGAGAMRLRGNPVLVQDEASCVVFGMPAAVMNAGAADAVVPLSELARAVPEWMAWKGPKP